MASCFVTFFVLWIVFSVRRVYTKETVFKLGILAERTTSEVVLKVAEYMMNETELLQEVKWEVIPVDSSALVKQMDYMQTACEIIKLDLAVLVTSINSDAITLLYPVFSALHAPIISTVASDPDLSLPGTHEYLIKMSAPDSKQGQVLADLIGYYGWSRLAIIQENSNYGFHGLQEFSKIALIKKWTITSFRVFVVPAHDEVLDITDHLLAVKKSGARIVLLYTHAQLAWEVLRQASELNMFSIGWAWIVPDGVTLSEMPIPNSDMINATDDDIASPFPGCTTSLHPEFIGVLGIQPSVGQGKHSYLMRDFVTNEIMQNADASDIEMRLFCQDSSTTGFALRLLDGIWLALSALQQYHEDGNIWTQRLTTNSSICSDRANIDPWPNGSTFMDYLNQMDVDGSMNYLNFTQFNTPGVADYSIVNLKDTGWVEVGQWKEREHLTITCQETFPGPTFKAPKDHDASLEKAHLDIVTIVEEPFVMLNDRYPHDSDEILIGLCLDLIKELQKILKFKYSLHLSKDGFYGARDPQTDTWNGMLYELTHFEADVSISALFITEERLQYFDMTNSYMDLGLDVLIAKEGVDGSPFNFLRPFDGSLWLSILGCNLACGVLVAFCSYMSPYGYRGRYIQRRNKENMKHRACRGELNFINSLWHAFVSLLTQGSNITAVATSGRIVAGFWFALCSILLATYTADLTAYLTVERMFTGIQTLMDLANQQDVKYGTLDGTAIQTFFAENGADPFPRMYKFMKQREMFVKNASVGVDMVRDSYGIAKGHPGKYALIYDSTVMEYMSRNEPCVTRTLGDVFRKMGYGLALRKDSPYTQAFNEAIMHLREAGIIEALAKKWINGPCPDPKSESDTSEAEQLTLSRMGGVFIFFFGGAAFAGIILIFEFITACYTDVVNDRLHKVTDTTFMQHMKRRFGDITADIYHIFQTLAISCGIFVPAEQTRKIVRSKWQKAGVSKTPGDLNPIATPQPCSMATSGSAFLDLYRKKKTILEDAPPPFEETVNNGPDHVNNGPDHVNNGFSVTNEDVMMY